MHYFLLDKIENDNPQDFTSAKLAASIKNPFSNLNLLKICSLSFFADGPLKNKGGENKQILTTPKESVEKRYKNCEYKLEEERPILFNNISALTIVVPAPLEAPFPNPPIALA